MVADLIQILAWWNVESEFCYLLDSRPNETLRTLFLFLFDTDLEKGFLNVSTQNHWFKSCSNQNVPQFVLKWWPFFQTIVKRIPRFWIGWSIIYYSQFCWLCIFCLITGLCSRKNSFELSLWFSETFSITLFTNWSQIT